ncbi:MAG TPA: hypothetical protein PLH57_10760, partial [Oligoflexia bacterium]|nr:hypothetical protein [Oligoflexia bacterium]
MLRKPRFLIRTRTLILGFALAAFGVTVPLLLKKDVARLASLYELIVDSEAFTEQSFELDATILLLTLELSEKSDNAKETLEQVNQQIRTLEDRRLPPSAMPGARQLRETFALWRTTTLAAVFSGERYTPMSDALAAQIRAINEELRM